MIKQLRGITWDHSRGLLPMVATAQRFQEIHTDIQITWEKRSLQAFADQPIQELAKSFDLLVIDHPFVGYAAEHPVLLPLDEFLSKKFLREQAANSVGASHASYHYGGHQWALAIDAATPVASWRPDLLKNPPRTWKGMIRLARKGRVVLPGVAVDALMSFYMRCVAEGQPPFQSKEHVIAEDVALKALAKLAELYSLCPPECFHWNPIRVYEEMTGTENYWYCPFAYGYSNYSRAGYARRCLAFGDLPDRLSSTLGGTGLAVARSTKHRKEALQYAQYVAGPECQRTIYTESGGQPGHRAAWINPTLNRLTQGYLRGTLPALDRAYVRPRYNGYLHFQDTAGPMLHRFLQRGGNPRRLLQRLNRVYQESLEQS